MMEWSGLLGRSNPHPGGGSAVLRQPLVLQGLDDVGEERRSSLIGPDRVLAGDKVVG